MANVKSPAIEARGIGKSYGEHRALDGFDLRVDRGAVCALLGRNGAGKTTAVRVLTTLLRADEGSATVDGHDVATQGEYVRRSVGLVGQHAAVDDVLTGRKNLTLFGRLNGLGTKAAAVRADELIERFGLDDAADRPVSGYSGGMRRRLDLAIGLVVAPSVLLVDEPTTGLDPEARRDLWASVRDLVADGVTVLLTTQYLEEAEALADQVAMLKDGSVVLEGSPAQLTSLVGDTWLELALSSPGDAERAARIAEPFAVRSDGVDVEGRRVAVPVAERAALTRLCGALNADGVEPVDLGVRRPSLDDVFLHVNRTSNDQYRQESTA